MPGELPRPGASRGARVRARRRPGRRRSCTGAERTRRSSLARGAGGRRAAIARSPRSAGCSAQRSAPWSTSSIPMCPDRRGLRRRRGRSLLEPARAAARSEAIEPAGGHCASRGRARGRPPASSARGSSGSRRSTDSGDARPLRDADRQSRRRDAARARGARERRHWSSARTRGTRAGSSSATASRRGCVSYHRHNEASRIAELVPRLVAGERMALVSDAGLPASRTRAPARRRGRAAGVPVTVLPGPSAVETALVSSGLAATSTGSSATSPGPSGRVRLSGRRSRAWPYPAVAFESPKRLPATLAARDGRSRPPVAVCRELTKLHEEVVAGPAASSPSGSARRRKGRSRSSSAARTSARTRPPVGMPSPPWPSSSPPEPSAASPPPSSPGSRESPATTLYSVSAVARFDNVRPDGYPVLSTVVKRENRRSCMRRVVVGFALLALVVFAPRRRPGRGRSRETCFARTRSAPTPMRQGSTGASMSRAPRESPFARPQTERCPSQGSCPARAAPSRSSSRAMPSPSHTSADLHLGGRVGLRG